MTPGRRKVKVLAASGPRMVRIVSSKGQLTTSRPSTLRRTSPGESSVLLAAGDPGSSSVMTAWRPPGPASSAMPTFLASKDTLYVGASWLPAPRSSARPLTRRMIGLPSASRDVCHCSLKSSSAILARPPTRDPRRAAEICAARGKELPNSAPAFFPAYPSFSQACQGFSRLPGFRLLLPVQGKANFSWLVPPGHFECSQMGDLILFKLIFYSI